MPSFRLALAVMAGMAVFAKAAVAQSPAVYYCDPLRVYSPPYSGSCPAPWRAVSPSPSVAPPPPARPVQQVPQQPGADIDDELSGWCAQVEKASSVVICSNRGLRQMALIRTKIFADARSMFSADAYKQLLSEQNAWVKTYSSACGAGSDEPAPAQPVASTTVDCFKRESLNRTVDLISRLRQQQAGYYPTSLSGAQNELVDQALEHRADEERAERARLQAAAAEQAERERQQREQEVAEARRKREQEEADARKKAEEELRRQHQADQQALIDKKLKDGGYKLEDPFDLELDWQEFMTNSQKVAMKGTYVERRDVEGLMIASKDMPFIKLYTDGASRDARKLMLECRENDQPPSHCKMIVAASIVPCARNERKLPCLKVEDAFLDPKASE